MRLRLGFSRLTLFAGFHRRYVCVLSQLLVLRYLVMKTANYNAASSLREGNQSSAKRPPRTQTSNSRF